jgi:hypothetical protein
MPAPQRFVPHHVEMRGIEAVEGYKNTHAHAQEACVEIGCIDRNDDGEGWHGRCGNCADKREARR